MVTKRTGKPRGRPKEALKDDPYLYLMTWFEATCRVCDNYKKYDVDYMSRSKLAVTLMTWLHGEFIDSERNWENLRVLEPVEFRTGRTVGGFEANPRYPTYFHVKAESFCKKVHKYNIQRESTQEGQLWHSLVQAWIGTLIQIPAEKGDEALGIILSRCDSVGEIEFFRRTLLPWFRAKMAGLPIPSFSLPDFFPQDSE